MSNDLFSVVFRGEVQEGHEIPAVQARLSEMFKMPLEKVQRLFNGNPVIIKQGLTHARALEYVQAFEKIGARVSLKRLESAPTVSKSPVQETLSTEQILREFKGEVKPVKVSSGYKFTISLAAFFMLMIPVVYTCLILLTIYGVYYHATENLTLFKMGSKYVALVIYLTPLVAGPILVIFMIKPLFANLGRPPNRVVLDPNTQPRIFAFVRRICDTVKAPYPAVIAVDCDVNASASFHKGISSFFSNELVLTIGLPLLGGMDIRTFAGILAHEFGHFSQGAAMRMTYIIYTVLYWLHVAVERRDFLDEKLEQWGRSEQTIVLAIVHSSRLFIWLTRKILVYMLKLGNFINYSMSRQMEFDADRYATRLIGSDNYKDISIQITRLVVANDAVHEEQNDAWYQKQVLVDDLTGAIISEYQQQPDDMEQRVVDYINEGKTHWQDTHPCDRERIENALKEQAEGVFHMTIPASCLINKFEKLSKELTFLQYRNIWGVPVTKAQLIPVERFEGDRKEKQENFAALERYFGPFFTVYYPVELKYPIPVTQEQREKYIAEWKKAYKAQQTCTQIKEQYDHEEKLFDKYGSLERADALIKGGFNIDAKEFELKSNDPDKVSKQLEDTREEYRRALNDIFGYCKIVFHRIQMALALSLMPEMDRKQLDQIAEKTIIEKVIKCQHRINYALNESRQLHFNFNRLGILLYNWQEKEEENPEPLRENIEKMAEICRRHIEVLQNTLATTAYPFEHAKENFSLQEHIFTYDVKDMSPPQIEGYSNSILGDLHGLQWRMMALLCRYVEQVEAIAGLVKPDNAASQ